MVKGKAVAAMAAMVLSLGLPLTAAGAEGRDCAAPLTDWQPREALVRALEAQGWTVLGVRIDDGCYKVKAVNAAGERMRGRYDPVTLEQRGGGHRHGGDDGADDDGPRHGRDAGDQ